MRIPHRDATVIIIDPICHCLTMGRPGLLIALSEFKSGYIYVLLYMEFFDLKNIRLIL